MLYIYCSNTVIVIVIIYFKVVTHGVVANGLMIKVLDNRKYKTNNNIEYLINKERLKSKKCRLHITHF